MNKKILNRMILDEWHSRCHYAFGTPFSMRHIDSNNFSNVKSYRKYRREAIRRVDMAIRRHDKKYNDFVTTALAIGAAKTTLLPIVIPLLKAGITAGVSAAVSAPLKKATEPIIGSLIAHIKELAKAKPEDQTYIEALCRDIKFQFGKLLDILKREGSWLYQKLSSPWSKVERVLA